MVFLSLVYNRPVFPEGKNRVIVFPSEEVLCSRLFLCKNCVKYSVRLGWRAALALLVHSECRVVEVRKEKAYFS